MHSQIGKMTAEKFALLLKEPSELENVTLHELETLKNKFPTSKNLQLLYLRKSKLLGSTQNEKETKHIAFQQQHPIMFTNFIDPENALENHESINELYQDIFDSLKINTVPIQEEIIVEKKEEEAITFLQNEIETTTIEPEKKEIIIDQNTEKQDSIEAIPIEKIEQKEKQSKIKEVKNIQFENIEEENKFKKDDISLSLIHI